MDNIWSHSQERIDWLTKHYGLLRDGIIRDITFELDHHNDKILWPCLTVEFKDGIVRKVYVQADEEGNKEGFLSIPDLER